MSGMPVDTVKVRFEIDPADLDLSGWRRTPLTCDVWGRDEVAKDEWDHQFRHINGASIHLIYRPIDLYRPELRDCLYVEMSIPKIIYGCNHHMIEDWQSVLDELNAILSRIPYIPKLGDIRDAPLYRLDIAANLQVGKNVSDYIEMLWKAYYPKRVVSPHIDDGIATGVCFRTKKGGNSLTFYDKHLQCHHEDAENMLRVEISLRKKPYIRDKFGVKDLCLGSLTKEAAFGLLEKEFKNLHLDRDMVCDPLEAECRLSERYSPRLVRTLMGHWLLRRTNSHQRLIERGSSRRGLYYYDRLLRDAGISNLTAYDHQTLPALLPELQLLTKSCTEPLSDTKGESQYVQPGGSDD